MEQKDYRIKVMRILGLKKEVELFIHFFEMRKEDLRAIGFDVLAPIQTKTNGSMLSAKIIFTSIKGLNTKRLEELSKDYKSYVSVHYLDYQKEEEYYFEFTPNEGLVKKEKYSIETIKGETVFSSNSPVHSGELHKWIK